MEWLLLKLDTARPACATSPARRITSTLRIVESLSSTQLMAESLTPHCAMCVGRVRLCARAAVAKAGVRIKASGAAIPCTHSSVERLRGSSDSRRASHQNWPRIPSLIFITAEYLHQQTSRALGDAADSPRFIETLPVAGIGSSHRSSGQMGQRPGPPQAWTARPRGRKIVVAAAVCSARGGNSRRTALAGAASAEADGKRHYRLGDFANSTGDAVFDGALREGLSVELEQSPF